VKNNLTIIILKIKNQIKNDKFLIKKLIFTFISRGISSFGTFIFNFVLAKFLNVSDFGHFMLAYSILVGLGFFARFGMSSAIMRFAAIMFDGKQLGKIKKLRRDVLMISILTSTILGLLLIISRSYLSDKIFGNTDMNKILLVFAFSLPFYSYQTIQSSFLKAYKRPELAPLLEIGLTAFLAGCFIAFLAFLGIHINGLVSSIVFLFSSIIVVYWGYIILSKIIRKAENGIQYDLEAYSGFYSSLPDYSLSAITTYLLKFSPTIILGFYATGKDIGLYSLSNTIAFVISFVLWIVSTVYAPYFASYYYQGKIKELSGLVVNATLYMLIMALPIFSLIVFFPSFVLSLFGDEYSEAKNALIIMAFAQLFNVITGPVYFLLNMTGHERKLRNIVLLTAIISISSSLILVPHLGYIGASIATAIGLIIQNSMAFYHSNKYLKIDLWVSFRK
jgi:O-antigen/teichoic acid export membrane protein